MPGTEEPRDILIPVVQATVTFYGQQIIAVRLPNGRIAATLGSLCAALQLQTQGQARRIRDDDVLVDQLLSAQIQTDGGPQPADVLTAWAIPTWLTGIKTARVAPQKRPAILAFKREAADALYKHFSQAQPRDLPAPSSLVPAEPITQPDYPPSGASPAVWLRYHQQMVAFLEWQQDMEAWREGIEDRLESVEEITRLVPELIERLGPATLSPEQQRTVQASVKHLHELSGASFGAIYAELNEALHVGAYKEIPGGQWSAVAAWFRARIEAAERRQKH